MTASKYLILLMTVLFFSCDNDPTNITEANNHYTDNKVNTIKKITNSQPVDTAILKVWSAFQKAIATNNIPQFRQLSLDSLYSCNKSLSTTKFIKACYKQVFDTTIARKIIISSEVNKTETEMELGYFTKSTLDKADFDGDAITLRQFQIVKQLTPDGAWTMTFDFIKTKKGYKFFGCDSYGGAICCH